MRRLGLFFLALGFWSVFAQAKSAVDQETALIHFPRTTAFADVLLEKGQYLIVHDDAMAALGEPCIFVYSARGGESEKLLVSMHCTRVQRPQTAGFKVVTRRITGNLYSIREVQFPGSMAGHQLY